MILAVLHSFVNIFAGGRSEIKTILFFLYLFFLSAIFILFKDFKFKKLRWFWFGFTVLCMYIYGLILHVFYIINNNLRITDFVITGNNGEISSSVIYHTHIAKAFIGQIFSIFGKNQFQTTDAGNAYIGIFPSFIFLIGSIILILLILQAVYYFSTSFRELLINKNKRQKIFLIIGYVLISFSLIKTSIDGGILSPSFILGAIFIILFIFREKGKLFKNYYVFSIPISVLFLFFGLFFYPLFYNKIYLWISTFTALFILYNFFFYLSEKTINAKIIISFSILFIFGWWQGSFQDRDIYIYSKTLIKEGQKVYFYDSLKKEMSIINSKKTEPISEFSGELGKNITYLPIAVPGVNCTEKSKLIDISFLLISREVPKFTNYSDFVQIKNETSEFKNSKWQTSINFLMNNCTPEILSVIDGELVSNNINNYLIVNLKSYDDILD